MTTHRWILFIFLSIFLLPLFPLQAQETKASTQPVIIKPEFDDYNYYKKYGRTSKAWNDLVKKGFEAYDQQDCEKTVSFLKEAITAGCNDPIVLFKLAACSELTGSYYSAAQYYKQAEDPLKILSPPHRYQKDFYEAYGRTLLLNKKTDEALPYLTKAGEIGTPSFELYYLLGELLFSKQQNQAAVSYFNKALSQPHESASPNQLARVYGALGRSYLELKDWEKAIQYLDSALKYAPTDNDLQQARYQAAEFRRQEQLFKLIQGETNPK
jgi:tetratricopeptide (TPR) repeat protein